LRADVTSSKSMTWGSIMSARARNRDPLLLAA
jgi:hypothetical protein